MSKIQVILQAIGEAGKNLDGSYTRACYSPEYKQAVAIVRQQMENLGMTVQEDAAGNIHGVLPGTDKAAKSIIIGSHLDTVPSGGLFDGAYGVASGLEVVRRLQESKRNLKHSLEIYGFNAEESNPIGGTFGSRAITGLVDTKQAGFKEALAQYGHTPEEIAACRRNFDNAKCYLELHIEQGDLLFNEGLNIGVVSGIVGIIRYRVTAIGRSNHAGTTMMKNRKDAMVAMSKLIVAADKRCREIDDTLVLTIGTIKIWPGSENVIPGKVECTFEMRHMDKSKTDQLIADIRKFAAEIPNAQFEIEKRVDKGGVNCNPHLMEIISAAAEKVKVSHIVMPSGAGHDANPMAHRVPVGMIFVPSKNGLSHCGEEWTEAQDLENGVNVLYNTVEALDKED